MKRIVLIALLTAAPAIALAGGDSGFITLTSNNVQIISDGGQRAFIYVTVNNSGCTNTTPELVMDSTNPIAAAMYSTILTAKATGQTVDIQTSGCTSSGFPIVTTIYLGT